MVPFKQVKLTTGGSIRKAQHLADLDPLGCLQWPTLKGSSITKTSLEAILQSVQVLERATTTQRHLIRNPPEQHSRQSSV